MYIRNVFRSAMLAVALGATNVACDSDDGPIVQHLRVRNVGTVPIGALRIAFASGATEFGDVPVGATTAYQKTGGVNRYGSYRFTVNDTVRIQLVDDFVGAVVETGRAFTYNVEILPTRGDSPWAPKGSPWVSVRSITREK